MYVTIVKEMAPFSLLHCILGITTPGSSGTAQPAYIRRVCPSQHPIICRVPSYMHQATSIASIRAPITSHAAVRRPEPDRAADWPYCSQMVHAAAIAASGLMFSGASCKRLGRSAPSLRLHD